MDPRTATTPARSGGELDPRVPRQLLLHEGDTDLLTGADGSIGASLGDDAA